MKTEEEEDEYGSETRQVKFGVNTITEESESLPDNFDPVSFRPTNLDPPAILLSSTLKPEVSRYTLPPRQPRSVVIDCQDEIDFGSFYPGKFLATPIKLVNENDTDL